MLEGPTSVRIQELALQIRDQRLLAQAGLNLVEHIFTRAGQEGSEFKALVHAELTCQAVLYWLKGRCDIDTARTEIAEQTLNRATGSEDAAQSHHWAACIRLARLLDDVEEEGLPEQMAFIARDCRDACLSACPRSASAWQDEASWQIAHLEVMAILAAANRGVYASGARLRPSTLCTGVGGC